MRTPDTVCPACGNELTFSKDFRGRVRSYCNPCRRKAHGGHPHDAPTCKRGHRKTPWTWKSYNKGESYRCIVCARESYRRYDQKRRKAA